MLLKVFLKGSLHSTTTTKNCLVCTEACLGEGEWGGGGRGLYVYVPSLNFMTGGYAY